MSYILISLQFSEPDSHNEFDVSTDEPQVDKPRPVVPLTPMEKENALVTLLDPTAVPDDEMKPVTGGMAESTDHPSASEDITDKSETIYLSEPEPSNDGGEEELLIITHEIETIHHNETGELVRDYVPTPLVILDLETDAPYISLSPHQIPEEDLSPGDEDSKAPSLDVTPTTQVLLTTAPAGEELYDLRFPATTLSAITGQPPTEPAANLQEDEEVNALPEEEEIDLGVLEPYSPNQDVSELVPEDELLQTDGELFVEPEEVLEVLKTTSEQTEVAEPNVGNVEMSEPDPEDKEVVVVILSEPEEDLVVEKNKDNVAVTEPNETEEEDYVEDSYPVEVSKPEDSNPEAEPDDSTVETLMEGGVEELQPEEDLVEITEAAKVIPEPETGLDEVSHPDTGSKQDKASELVGGVDEVSEQEEKVVDAGSEETGPEISEPETVDVEQVEEEVAVIPVPEYDDVESEVVEKVTEATADGQALSEPELAPGEKSHATELTRTGYEVSEATEEKEKGVSEPSETVLEVVDLAEQQDATEVPQVEDAKEEEEVIVVPTPDEETVDALEPQLPPEAEDKAEKENIVDNPQPEEASEPGEDTVHVLPPAEDSPGVSQPESNEEVVVEITKPRNEGVDVPELNPEEGAVETLEPDPERDITEPPAESIKILHPLHDVENLHHGEDSSQVVEELLQPVEPDYYRPIEEENVPIIPIDTQPFDDSDSEVDHEYPISEDIYAEEGADRVESDIGAASTTEAAKSDVQVEMSSDNTGEQESIALQSMKYD